MKKQKNTMYNLNSTAATLVIKCYDEQIRGGYEQLKATIEKINPSEYQVLAIRHNRDEVGDGFWKSSLEKCHYHILMRKMDSLTKTSKNPPKVRTYLKTIGVVFRKDIDDILLKKRAIEPARDFSNYAIYLTHDTEQAIIDGKARYDVSEIISNLSEEGVKQIRDGYINPNKKKVSYEELVKLDKVAYERGFELKSFRDWYKELSLIVRSNTKMKQIKEHYDDGVKDRILENDYQTRLCIFIKGTPNSGKTYNTRQALKEMGIYNVLSISGGGTGKYDKLETTTEAIICDDDTLPNLLNIADNKIVQAYKRGNNNPWWTGKYLIVTSNLDFEKWLNECGMYKTAHIEAMKSRFYICELRKYEKDNKIKLFCESPSERGSIEQQTERLKMYNRFKDAFNKSIANYEDVKEKIDYSNINNFLITPITTEIIDKCNDEELNNITLQEKIKYLNQITVEQSPYIPMDEWEVEREIYFRNTELDDEDFEKEDERCEKFINDIWGVIDTSSVYSLY